MSEVFVGMEDWIDFLASLWGFQWNGTQIECYKVWGREPYPGQLQIPAAVTFVEYDAGDYSSSEGGYSLITGVTELHLFENEDRRNVPLILPLFEQIIKTAAKNMGLNNSNNLTFLLTNDTQGRIRGPLGLVWGDEIHLGLTIHWTVFNTQVFQVSLTP